ncbi:sulfopyruvate decarboxylase subunit alpha [archaeon]
MSISSDVLGEMKDAGIDFVTSVPCILLAELLELLDKEPSMTHLPVTREEEGMGVCAGAYLAGKTPAMLMQNSGLGNSINALASLVLYYDIPLVLIFSHRGTEGEKINAQVPMGDATPKLLDAVGIEYITIESAENMGKIRDAIKKANSESKPVAVLLPFSFWGERQ